MFILFIYIRGINIRDEKPTTKPRGKNDFETLKNGSFFYAFGNALIY